MLNGLPDWLRIRLRLLVGLIAFGAIAVILAWLLDFVPPYVLFVLIFVIGFGLLWWKAVKIRSPLAFILLALFWASATLLLYAGSLMVKQDYAYIWWLVLAGICFGSSLLIAWAMGRNDKKSGAGEGQPVNHRGA